MTSETDYAGEEVLLTLESPNSSGGEEGYDDASFGSDVQPPALATGFAMVLEDSCRAVYRGSRRAKDLPFYVCLNNAECRSLAGGKHSFLRTQKRAEPGVYEGVYGKNGKLVAAQDGTRTTPESLSKIATERRQSDRAQALGLQDLTSGLERSTETSTVGGLLNSKLTQSEAEDLVATEIDQGGGGDILESANPSKEDLLLRIMSSLVDKIDRLDSGLTRRDNENTTILRSLMGPTDKAERSTATGHDSILRPATFNAEEPVSSTAQKHAAAGRRATKATKAKKTMKTTGITTEQAKTATNDDDDYSPDEGGWSDYDSQGQVTRKGANGMIEVIERPGHRPSWSDSAAKKEQGTARAKTKQGRKKTRKGSRNRATADDDDYTEEEGSEIDSDEDSAEDSKRRRPKGLRVASSRARLYAIARGKGGIKTVGLYREPWDRIEFLV